MRTVLFLLLAMLAPGHALAANQVALDNAVFVERVSTDAQGKQKILLEEPKVVVPGDRLVFVLNYRNAGAQPADKFVITNPMPSAVRFADAGDTRPFVSVDGGKQWGLLADLSVPMEGGSRRAARRCHARPLGFPEADPGRRHGQSHVSRSCKIAKE